MTNQTAERNIIQTHVIEYRLYVKGLFGRNRKVKGDSLALVDVPVEAPAISDSMLNSLVADKLASIKAKPGLAWKVLATDVTITRNGGPFVSRSFMMFTGKTVASGSVAC